MLPPIAPRRAHQHKIHGDVRLDHYHWMRNRDDPAVKDYLTAENTYLDDTLAHTAERQAALFDEIKGRIKQTDISVPYRDGSYYYYYRYEEGQEYRVYCRKPLSGDAETVVLDVNFLANRCDYCEVGAIGVSPDEKVLAYAVDTVGRRQYDIRFRNLVTGLDLADVIPGVTSNFVWANDNQTLFYTRQHETTLRSHEVCRHRLGADVSCDHLIFEERDDTFGCGVGKSRSKRYILIETYQTLTTEYHLLDADDPASPLQVFEPRRPGHEYHVDHFRGRFYIRSNANAKNFCLFEAPDNDLAALRESKWCELIPHRDDVLIEGFEMFRDHLVLQERCNGLVNLRIWPWSGEGEHNVKFPESAYEAFIDAHNKMVDTTVLRFGYSSLSTPESDYDYDMVTQERTLLKRAEVLGDFDSQNYRTERIFATGPDGVQIPISLVSRVGISRGKPSPLLLYGYGSYGISMDAGFRSPRLSLLDRGFVFAIAHIRGGQELGRQWYDDGKLLQKKNTFVDFLTCAEHLVDEGYTSPKNLYAMGGSAGGLLMGAIVNLRPDLFHGVVAQVPFVDVLTTMLDDSIPLTTGEYDEWGNPNNLEYYEYIKSYSPYDNVSTGPHPHLLVITGLHDSQVQYWEPAKWVARLRHVKCDDNLLVFKTNMDAGHGGASGRYQRYKEMALQYAFLLDLAGR